MKTRIISALVGIPIVIGVLYFGGFLLTIFLALLSGIGVYELYGAFEAKGFKPLKKVGVVMAVLYILVKGSPFSGHSVLILYGALMGILFYEVMTQKHTIVDISLTFFGYIYVPMLFSYLGDINRLENGVFLVWLPILAAWYTDSMAYFVGLSIGKHKMAPVISPKKTIEGAVGGFLGNSILMVLTGYIALRMGVKIPLYHYAAIGIITGITAQIGDLAASYIKRYCEIKDYGHLIPGHGGIMDRFDSILFTAPTVMFYLIFVMKIQPW